MLEICAISGSLRKRSVNTALLKAMQASVKDDAKITFYEELASLPLFNPDLEGMEPLAVLNFRKAIKRSDGVLIASPEYAHGITGVLKNALDWIVGSGELVFKPVALLNASSRAIHAYESLQEIIKTMDANIVKEASAMIALPNNLMTETDILAVPELLRKLEEVLRVFVDAIKRKN